MPKPGAKLSELIDGARLLGVVGAGVLVVGVVGVDAPPPLPPPHAATATATPTQVTRESCLSATKASIKRMNKSNNTHHPSRCRTHGSGVPTDVGVANRELVCE